MTTSLAEVENRRRARWRAGMIAIAGTGASLGLALFSAGALTPWMLMGTMAAAALALVSASSRAGMGADTPMREQVRALARIDALRRESLTVPLVGFVTIAPLSAATLAGWSFWGGAVSFHLLAAALVAGPGLVVLGRSALRFSQALDGQGPMSAPEIREFAFDALRSSAFAALFLPGLVVLGSPELLSTMAVPFLTAVTAASFFTPAAYRWVARAHAGEQLVLQDYRAEQLEAHQSELVRTHTAIILDRKESLEFRSGALDALIGLGGRKVYGEVLDQLIASGPVPLAAKALQTASERRYTPSIAVLDEAVRRGHPTLCGPAVRLAVRCHRKRILPWLLRWLELPLDGVRVPVLEALGRIGDRDAVVAIHAAMTQPSADFFPVPAARAAIAEIQERLRLEPASGALALVDHPEGALGLAPVPLAPTDERD